MRILFKSICLESVSQGFLTFHKLTCALAVSYLMIAAATLAEAVPPPDRTCNNSSPNTTGGASQTKVSGGVSLPPGVKQNWWSQVQKQLAEKEYEIGWVEKGPVATTEDGSWQAPNRAHELRTYFTNAGPRVVPRGGKDPSWVWGLELVNAPVVTSTKHERNRFEYHREGGLVEWYMNCSKGLEQGFTIPSSTSPQIVLDIAVTGGLVPSMTSDGKTIEFRTDKGEKVVRYGGLQAEDASGKTLASRIEVVNQSAVRLIIDATNARYPVIVDPLATSAACIWESNANSAYFGWSVACAGDVNGDGYSDVVVGAPTYDNGQEDEGCAMLYCGSGAGLSSTATWKVESNRLWFAQFGISVASAGDVNGDGYSDVIVGANHETSTFNHGAAFVYHGSASGLSSTHSWITESEQFNSQLGYSVASAGDVNGDGYSDVIVGEPYYDNGQAHEGRARIYNGSPSGLSATASWSVESDQAEARFGFSVASAGDLNGDGFSDVIVGSPYHNNRKGCVYVYHGSASGMSTNHVWSAEGDLENCNFGQSVASAGDVNGDGYCDVIVGAPWRTGRGQAYVYQGSALGLSAVTWTGAGVLDGEGYGYCVAGAGDVNGDGYSDVVVGAPYKDGEQIDSGQALMYYGTASGVSATASWTVQSNQTSCFGYCVASAGDTNGDGCSDLIVGAPYYANGEPYEGSAFVYEGHTSGLTAAWGWVSEDCQGGEQLGCSVASAGDVNGDGYSDVIIGACGYDNGEADEGRAYVYHGSASGLSSTPAWTVESNQTGAQMGWAVASAGDVNGDGYSDVIVGAPTFDNGQTDEGRAYVYNGSPSGLAATPAWTAESDQTDAFFGFSVGSAGDVNGDGWSDVIVGSSGRFTYLSPFKDSTMCQAFVYHGSSAGLSCNANWMTNEEHWYGLGYSVACAGDVNGDGYSDVIVGVFGSSAFVYHGSPSGLSSNPSWIAGPDNYGGYFFNGSVASAGDVNGDGYSDVVFSMTQTIYKDNAYVYVHHGSSTGLSNTPTWTILISSSYITRASPVACAGDVNGDGFSDVILGSVNSERSLACLYHGSPSGLSGTPAWQLVASTEAAFGGAVASAGDVNGDGYSDVITGRSFLRDTDPYTYVFFGNSEGGTGLAMKPQQFADFDGTNITPDLNLPLLGKTNLENGIEVGLNGRTPYGGGKVKLHVQVWTKTPTNGLFGEALSNQWVDSGAASNSLRVLVPITSPPSDSTYYWRARLLYHPATSQGQASSRWFTSLCNGAQDTFRLPEPNGPSEPRATAITTETIAWTWTDNSSAETGYKIWADEGKDTPNTLRFTTVPNAAEWLQEGLTPNTQYTFQAAASNSAGDSTKTETLSAWTLAATPVAPTVTALSNNIVNVQVSFGDANPAATEYAIRFETTGQWVQVDGSLSALPAWRTASEWSSCNVTGLTPRTAYRFSAGARNGAGIETLMGPSAGATTLPVSISGLSFD